MIVLGTDWDENVLECCQLLEAHNAHLMYDTALKDPQEIYSSVVSSI